MPKGSILAWSIDAENYMCLELTDEYYDRLCLPGGHASTLAETVINDERVQAILVPKKYRCKYPDGRIEDSTECKSPRFAGEFKVTILETRKIVTAVVTGAEKPPKDADLVAWSLTEPMREGGGPEVEKVALPRHCVAQLPDGLRFISGSHDQTARIVYHGLAPVR